MVPQRKHVRIPSRASARVSLSSRSIDARLENVSRGGLGLSFVGGKLQTGRTADVELWLDAGTLRVRGRIVWVREVAGGAWEAGVKLDRVPAGFRRFVATREAQWNDVRPTERLECRLAELVDVLDQLLVLLDGGALEDTEAHRLCESADALLASCRAVGVARLREA